MEHAANMRCMKYSEALAAHAKLLADKCRFSHEVPSGQGQNLYVTTNLEPPDFSGVVDYWASERSYFTHDGGSGQCTPGKMCGHYTQIVWATTTTIGCAMARCGSIVGVPFRGGIIVVCNYSPAGNWIGQPPYVVGASCSQCPHGTACQDDLCCEAAPSIIGATAVSNISGSNGNTSPGFVTTGNIGSAIPQGTIPQVQGSSNPISTVWNPRPWNWFTVNGNGFLGNKGNVNNVIGNNGGLNLGNNPQSQTHTVSSVVLSNVNPSTNFVSPNFGSLKPVSPNLGSVGRWSLRAVQGHNSGGQPAPNWRPLRVITNLQFASETNGQTKPHVANVQGWYMPVNNEQLQHILHK